MLPYSIIVSHTVRGTGNLVIQIIGWLILDFLQMEFPFKFACEYSPRQQGPFEQCTCTVLPLLLVLELPVDKKVYKLLDMRRREARLKGFMLAIHSETVCLKVEDAVNFRVCESMLATLVPEGDFLDFFKKEELIEALSGEGSELYVSEQRRSRTRVMLRKMPIHKKTTSQELEAIWLLQNRCLLKPEHLFVEGNMLKLIYKPFSGTLLKRQTRKKRLPDEEQLRQFAVKLLFLLSEIENKGMELLSLREDLILLQGMKYSAPVILDLSGVQPYDVGSNEGSHSASKTHQVELAGMLYRIITYNKVQDSSEWARLARWIKGDMPPYCEAMGLYRKSLFEFIYELREGSQETQAIMKHKWLIEKCTKKEQSKRLATIKSMGATMSFTDTEELELEQMEDQEEKDDKEISVQVPEEPSYEYEYGEMTIELRMSQLQRTNYVPFQFWWVKR